MLQVQIAPKGTIVKIDSIIATYRKAERSALEEKRYPMYVEDYLLYQETVLWSVLDSGVPEKTILNAGRSVFARQLMSMTEKKYTPGSEICGRLSAVARRLDMEGELQAFFEGRFAPKKNPLFNFAKSILRKLFHKLAAVRQG
jgi:hypothetical protein